jgi:hypothetical protein
MLAVFSLSIYTSALEHTEAIISHSPFRHGNQEDPRAMKTRAMSTSPTGRALAGVGWVLGLLAVVAPAFAGSVYLPIASNETIVDKKLHTELWISNPTGETLEATTLFISTRTDGTVADRNLLAPLRIPPGATFFINNAVPAEASGMLEINADPELVFSSKLVTEDGEASAPGARVPLVSSENLIPGGGVAELLGLARTPAGTVSSVGLINLSQEPATCTARVFTSAGVQMGGTATLPVTPLTHVQFNEALAILGLEDANHVRVEISCDQDFYAYGVVLGREPDETLFIQPSVSGDSSLLAPGLLPPFVEFRAPGNFLVATRGNPYEMFQLPVEPGVSYGSIEIDFDFFLGAFNSNLFHTIFSLRSDGLFCELTIRGDNSRTFFDTPDQSVRATGPWRPGRDFHIHVVYDVVNDVAVLEVSQFGEVSQRLEARANRSLLGALDGSLRLDFSQRKVFDDAFFPLWGSTFSNLQVRAFEQ